MRAAKLGTNGAPELDDAWRANRFTVELNRKARYFRAQLQSQGRESCERQMPALLAELQDVLRQHSLDGPTGQPDDRDWHVVRRARGRSTACRPTGQASPATARALVSGLEKSARDLGPPGRDGIFGHGLIDSSAP
jgi:hypothetical protein